MAGRKHTGDARRIGCLERFIDLMGKQREEIVRLLLWEIGKARKDAAILPTAGFDPALVARFMAASEALLARATA